MDAVCSGHQHLSGMFKEVPLAKLVNMHPTNNPQDLYQIVGEGVVQNLPVELVRVIEKYGTRKFLKHACIATPYGITPYSIVNNLHSKLIEVRGPELKIYYKRSDLKGRKGVFKYIVPVFKEEYNKVCGDVDLRRDCLGRIILNVPGCQLIIPDGFLLNTFYYKKLVVNKSIEYIRERYHINISLPYKSKNKLKVQHRALVNYIHCRDALLICLCITLADLPMLPIHDCIIVPLDKVEAATKLGQQGYDALYGGERNMLVEVLDLLSYKHKDLFDVIEPLNMVKNQIKNDVLVPTRRCFVSDLGRLYNK